MTQYDAFPLWLTAVVTVAYQLCFFFTAYFFQFDKVTDFAGGSNFALNALITIGLSSQNSLLSSKKIVATVCVIVWAVRLSGFLLLRVLKAGDDKRFDEMRKHFFQFLGFWIFQMLWVYICGFSVVLLNSSDDTQPFGQDASDIAGLVLFVLGLIIEAVADQQKFHYRFNYVPQYKSEHNGKMPPILQDGVWYFSRQPNYFGELLVWWGLFILCLTRQNNSGITYVTFVSPVFITLLLLFLSGIPLSEKGNQKRYLGRDNTDAETRQNYMEYRQRTSPLIMMPTQLYVKFPLIVKRFFFFEFQLYEGPKLNQDKDSNDEQSGKQ